MNPVLAVVFAVTIATAAATWNYDEASSSGPQHWADIGYPTCANNRQSPIDIVTSTAKPMTCTTGLTFSGYDTVPTTPYVLENNGHSVEVIVPANTMIMTGAGLPGTYALEQFHFHWGVDSSSGSEHTIDGKSHPLELHMVHFNRDKYQNVTDASKSSDPEAIAVLGIFIDTTDNAQEVNTDLAHLSEEFNQIPYEGDEIETEPFQVDHLLPSLGKRSFYRYLGSLTTPGCAQVVAWTVFAEPLYITPDELQMFRQVHGDGGEVLAHNYRPTQPSNSRTIYYGNVNCGDGKSSNRRR